MIPLMTGSERITVNTGLAWFFSEPVLHQVSGSMPNTMLRMDTDPAKNVRQGMVPVFMAGMSGKHF